MACVRPWALDQRRAKSELVGKMSRLTRSKLPAAARHDKPNSAAAARSQREKLEAKLRDTASS